MQRWTTSRLPEILDAMTLSEDEPAVRGLANAFGGDPVSVRELTIGEPARRSRRLLFASGGEIVVDDGAVSAVLLHVAPAPGAARGLDLPAWVPGAGADATLDDLKEALGASVHFAGFGEPYFTLDGAYARVVFRNKRGWKDPGNLLGLVVTVDKPHLALHPEDDDCPTCSDLLVRLSDTDSRVDVDATVESLAAAVAADLLTQDSSWVPLADLRLLQASGLMDRAESQVDCTTCRRIVCLTLFKDAPATFGFYVRNDAMRRPLEPIPPVEHWGDEARLAKERDAMHYVDHRPGGWFLVEQHDALYLDARYVVTSMVDDSALIRLDESEVEAYRAGGHDYLSELAMSIHDGQPHREDSRFFERNLYRGPDAQQYREAVRAAIVNHTWIAQQRRPT